MTTYTRCCGCGHLEQFTGNFSSKPCPKCGKSEFDMQIGPKPDWWKS